MLIISIGFVGDSLSSGLSVDFAHPAMWFNSNTHHGREEYGFVDAFDEKIREFQAEFTRLLNKTESLKTVIPKISIRFNTVARPGVNLAHFNPSIDPIDVPEQFYGPQYIHSQAANSQLDFALVALGTNDTQDYNAMAVEVFLNKLDDSDFEIFMTKLKGSMPAKVEEIFKLTTRGSQRKTELVGKIVISREENQGILKQAQGEQFKSVQATHFLQDWDRKQYWNKNSEEIQQILKKVSQCYQNAQHMDQRGYPFSMGFILPPAYEGKGIIYPSYHAIGKKIEIMRDEISKFAHESGMTCFDFNDICQILDREGQPKYCMDNIHLSSKFYEKLSSEFPFMDILLNTVNTRISAVLSQAKSKNLHSEHTLLQAEKELELILSAMNQPAFKKDTSASSIKQIQNLLLLGTKRLVPNIDLINTVDETKKSSVSK